MHQPPQQHGFVRTRWTLAALCQHCAWLQVGSPAALYNVLQRLGVHYKQGRHYVHSPDLLYAQKVAAIDVARQLAQQEPLRFPLLYLDEMSFYRRPTLASAYAACGRAAPCAPSGYGRNTQSRILAALDSQTGQVFYTQRSQISVPCLASFWSTLCNAYPAAETIHVVVDNWPVHFHADVLAPLEAQRTPFPLYRPHTWPARPKPTAKRLNLPVQLLPLPTYAPWLNAIEKLWRKLRQDVIHMHRHAGEWSVLKERVDSFLQSFANGSQDLLHYVGLSPG